MISEVVMPQMGADMEEGTIIRWVKQEGAEVARGEIIAEIETDKANVEIEAFESGIFRKTLANEGDVVAVGIVIAVIASPEDDISQYEGVAAAAQPVEAKTAAVASPASQAPTPVKEAPATPNGRVRVSPVARKLANERGIDLAQIQGSGPDGRIVRRDVEAAVAEMAASTDGEAPEAAPAQAVKMSRMRQTIARRMTQSKQEAPHYYVTVDIDMTEAERLRHQLNNAFHRELHVSVNDLIVKASALALERHPMFNSWFVDGEVSLHNEINISIAIALEDGLIAPAILDAGNKRLDEISQDTRSLAKRAKSGALKPEEYSGGTFTVSNLGMFDVEMLIAIIQPPQTAILGVGTVRPAPVVRDGDVAVAELMKVALSADHRATDGAQGAQFLHDIRRLLESPAALLV